MKFCKRCNTETERQKSGKCKPCVRAYTVAWRAANPERHKSHKAAWYVANANKIKARTASRLAANPVKRKAYDAAWRKANPKKSRAYSAAWAKANPESCRIKGHNRRALEAGGKLSQGLAAKLLKLQRGLCPCCKQPLGEDYHRDHIMPLALGGANEDWNIQLLRATCNNQKRAKHPIDFMQSRGFLL